MQGKRRSKLGLHLTAIIGGVSLLGFTSVGYSLTDGFEAANSDLLPAPVIACVVDTRTVNQCTPNACISLVYGGGRKSEATFHVLNIDPEQYDFAWSIPSCEGYHCTREITAYRTLNVDVAVVHRDTGQEWLLSAEAIYENGY